MVACPTGPEVDAWVLDIDDPVAFEAACTVTLPATRKSVTGKGYHLWFRWDAAAPMRNAQRSARGWPFPKLPGAEVRGEGGYVILPPSLHPNGRTYLWECDEPALEAPAELLALMCTDPTAAAHEDMPAMGTLAAAVRAGEDTGYGMAALRAECVAISIAPAGA
jgi:putative DNA primase/helicase